MTPALEIARQVGDKTLPLEMKRGLGLGVRAVRTTYQRWPTASSSCGLTVFSKAKERRCQHAVMTEAHRDCSERLACGGQVGHAPPADFRFYLFEARIHR